MAGIRTQLARGVYHGWLVVGAAFLIALFGWGMGFYGLGIYLVALGDRHGWSASEISPAITTYYLLGATLVFFAGAIFERFSARQVVGVGSIAMALGVVLLTLVSRLWQVYMAFAIMSVGWAAMSGAAINIIIAPWFDKRRGLAVSLALNGASAGGVAIAPLLIFLIYQFGFTTALIGVATILFAAIAPIAALILRPKRAGECDHADEDALGRLAPPSTAGTESGPPWKLSSILRSGTFQTTSIPFALGLTAQVGFLTHQVAYLSPLVGTVGAGWAVSVTAFSGVLGRIATGFFIDRVDRRAATCGNFLIQIAGMALLTANGPATALYLGCVLFGLGVGNMISLPGLLVQQEFPKQHFSRIVSLVVAINQFTFAFGPGVLGYLQRVGGGYKAPLIACLVMEAAAAIIVISPMLGRTIHRLRKKDLRS